MLEQRIFGSSADFLIKPGGIIFLFISDRSQFWVLIVSDFLPLNQFLFLNHQQ